MKVNGIIAEYNPFHNGHQYHLEAAKTANQADYTIVAMSGDFMQRGTPAILDKYKRTEMALCGGADLVLEIPVFYSLGSAEYFANGAVSLLDKLGVVNTLCFGSECGQKETLQQIASILVDEPEEYKIKLKAKLKQGCSYPNARSFALLEYCPSLNNAMEIFTFPNNILGIEYIKSILHRNSSIVPFTTKRLGSDYHDKRMNTNQSSALAIRSAIFSRQNWVMIQDQMPESSYHIMHSTWETLQPVHMNDFSALLHYKLLSEAEKGYDCYVDVSSDLSNRILNNLYNYTNFHDFCDILKSKDITYTRISRCLMHILLNIKKADLENYIQLDYIPYARVLGFKRDALPLLSAIKDHSSIPMISKLADADKLLEGNALEMLKHDISASNVYNSMVAQKSRQPMQNEYSTPIVII